MFLLLLSFTRRLHHLAHFIMWLSLFVKVIVHCPLLAPISVLLCFFSVVFWWGLGGLLAFCRDYTRSFGLCLNPTRRIFFPQLFPCVAICICVYVCIICVIILLDVCIRSCEALCVLWPYLLPSLRELVALALYTYICINIYNA